MYYKNGKTEKHKKSKSENNRIHVIEPFCVFSGRYPVTHLFLGRPDFQNAEGNDRSYNYPDKVAD